MRIALTKVSDDRHRLGLIRDDARRESVELVSRSFLWHDFLHYAVETNADLLQSFWGLLASGKTLAELHDAMSSDAMSNDGRAGPSGEAAITEVVVGVLTNVVRARVPSSAAIDGLARLLEAQGRDVPIWFTADFVERVREQMRKLIGEWRALPYGREMELLFPAIDFVPTKTKARPETGAGSRAKDHKWLLISSRHS